MSLMLTLVKGYYKPIMKTKENVMLFCHYAVFWHGDNWTFGQQNRSVVFLLVVLIFLVVACVQILTILFL